MLGDFWEHFIDSLKVLCEKQQRIVNCLTLVEAWNADKFKEVTMKAREKKGPMDPNVKYVISDLSSSHSSNLVCQVIRSWMPLMEMY